MFVTDDYFSFNSLIGESLDYPNTRETAPFNPNLSKIIQFSFNKHAVYLRIFRFSPLICVLVVYFHILSLNYYTTAGFYGTRLRYAAIRVNLTLATSGLNYVRGLPIRDKWEQFVTNEVNRQMMKEMPSAGHNLRCKINSYPLSLFLKVFFMSFSRIILFNYL